MPYKAAADNVAPTNGWIYAMEGRPVGNADLDGVTNFQDYIVLERFGLSGKCWEGGDFNNDGVVNFQDYIILERNCGGSYVSTAAPQDVASPTQLAASVSPATTTLTVSTTTSAFAPLVSTVSAPITVATATVLSAKDGVPALAVEPSTLPAPRKVTWARAVGHQTPPVKGSFDVLGLAL